MKLRDAIRHHLASCIEPATTVEVAERIGSRPEQVQTEMLMMHNEGFLVVTEWHTVGGRKRPAFQLADGSGRPALPPHTDHPGHKEVK